MVLTLFLRFLLPVCRRAKLVFCGEADMKFDKKQITTLICLVLVGSVSAVTYLAYRYNTSSRSADYKTEERVAIQKSMADLVLEKTDEWDEETVICVVDSAYRGLFQSETDYTVAVYTLDEEAPEPGPLRLPARPPPGASCDMPPDDHAGQNCRSSGKPRRSHPRTASSESGSDGHGRCETGCIRR